MPNGPTHRKISNIVQIASAPAIFYMNFGDFLALQAGLTVATYITNDLDLYNPLGGVGEFLGFGTYKRTVTHRAGLRLKDWKRLFIPSEKTGQRMTPWQLVFFSHLPWIGTLMRTILCFLPVLVLLLMFQLHVYLNPAWVIWLWNGMGIQDAAHSLADLIDSSIFKEISPGYHVKKEQKERLRQKKEADRGRRMQGLS